MSKPITKSRPEPDQILVDIARYVKHKKVDRPAARQAACHCLMDALGCAFQALSSPECTKLLGPVVPGLQAPVGARVPGTQFQLDPVTAAFNIGTLVRWTDHSDTWWNGGHPSDNIGGILAIADYVSRVRIAAGKPPLLMREVITALIKAYEIQGVICDRHTFNVAEVGIDSTPQVKMASVAVATDLLGGSEADVVNAISNAVVDGHPLYIYRKAPNAGSRKSWASGDATSRAVWLALLTMRGEMGYPQAFTAETWGFQDVYYSGKLVDLPRALGTYVVENVTFKISYPTQRHLQTTAECAVKLHPLVRQRLKDIERIEVHTHDLAWRMMCGTGPLPNFAARDHSLQYVAAVGLIDGDIKVASYSDNFYAAHPEIDELRAKMTVAANAAYTRGYRDASVRSNTSAIQVFFKDRTKTPKIEYEYPVGDPGRRKDGIPLLKKKFASNLSGRFPAQQQERIAQVFEDHRKLEVMPVHEFMDLLVI